MLPPRRARAASTRKLPDLRERKISARRCAASKPRFPIVTDPAISRSWCSSKELVNRRNWLRRQARISAEAADTGARARTPIALLDGVVADVLNSPECVQDLLGRQPDLLSALCTLIDIIAKAGGAAPRTCPRKPGLYRRSSSAPSSSCGLLAAIARGGARLSSFARCAARPKLNHGDP